MANPGGKSTMLGHWRIVLRQAEEAARTGRYDEALALAGRPDVADHHQAGRLRAKWALDLIARAQRRGTAADVTGAADDLELAERFGAPPDTLAAARLSLADRVAADVRIDLDAGEPARVVERIEQFARKKIAGPALRRAREVAEAWQAAIDETRRGEFGRAHDQLDRAERLAGGCAEAALAAARRDLEARQKSALPKVEALYTALAASKWPEILAAAEAVLEVVAEHPAARQARTRAWQQIAAISPSASWPSRGSRVPQAASPRDDAPAGDNVTTVGNDAAPIVWLTSVTTRPAPPAPSPPMRPLARAAESGPKGRFLLWVDAVGGYLVCLDDQIILGRAGHDGHADVPLMGDLARDHATLIRDGDGYLLRANHPTYVNGRQVETTPLRDGDVIRLGPTVELEFRQPSPVSATARLSIVSRHRLPLAVDGVLLMAETCIIGPAPQAHILARSLTSPVVLYRQGTSLWCRASESFEVDGRACGARAPLTLQSSVLGDGFSFSLEALGPKASQV
jgi:hypothetical protein